MSSDPGELAARAREFFTARVPRRPAALRGWGQGSDDV